MRNVGILVEETVQYLGNSFMALLLEGRIISLIVHPAENFLHPYKTIIFVVKRELELFKSGVVLLPDSIVQFVILGVASLETALLEKQNMNGAFGVILIIGGLFNGPLVFGGEGKQEMDGLQLFCVEKIFEVCPSIILGIHPSIYTVMALFFI